MIILNDVGDCCVCHWLSLFYKRLSPLFREWLLSLSGQDIIQDVWRGLAIARFQICKLNLQLLDLGLEPLVVLLQKWLGPDLQLQQLLGGLEVILQLVSVLQIPNIIIIPKTESLSQLFLSCGLPFERFYTCKFTLNLELTLEVFFHLWDRVCFCHYSWRASVWFLCWSPSECLHFWNPSQTRIQTRIIKQ